MEKSSSASRPKQNALKYGGEGAVRRISEGKPLIGIAADEEQAVSGELANAGVFEFIRRDAIRLQTATNLYWNAVQKAAQDGEIDALDRYVARFGWLSGVTLRAWAQVAQGEKTDGRQGVIDAALKDIQGAGHGED